MYLSALQGAAAGSGAAWAMRPLSIALSSQLRRPGGVSGLFMSVIEQDETGEHVSSSI